MSIVVAVKKGNRTVMACDSAITFGDLMVSADNIISHKIRRIGSSLLGSVGLVVYENILDEFLTGSRSPALRDQRSVYRLFLKLWDVMRDGRHGLVNPKGADDDESPFVDLDTAFIVANKKGIFRIGPSMDVTTWHRYCAIGSGRPYALGALYNIFDEERDPRSIAEQAVRTAINFDTDCGGDVVLLEAR